MVAARLYRCIGLTQGRFRLEVYMRRDIWGALEGGVDGSFLGHMSREQVQLTEILGHLA